MTKSEVLESFCQCAAPPGTYHSFSHHWCSGCGMLARNGGGHNILGEALAHHERLEKRKSQDKGNLG